MLNELLYVYENFTLNWFEKRVKPMTVKKQRIENQCVNSPLLMSNDIGIDWWLG